MHQPNRTTLAERIARARNHAELSLAGLAGRISKITGVPMTAAQIHALETGAARASGRLVHIAIACGVRAEWLMLQEGGMLSETPETADHQAPTDALTSVERMLVGRYRLLPPAQQHHIGELIRALALPMDPRYRAWEAARAAEIDSRD